MKNVCKAVDNKEQRCGALVKFLSDSEKLVDKTRKDFSTVSEEAHSVGIVNNEESSAAIQLIHIFRKMVGRRLDTGTNTSTRKKRTTIEAAVTLASVTPIKRI